MTRHQFAALLSVAALALLLVSPGAACVAALGAIALVWDSHDLREEEENEHRSDQGSADRAHHPR